MFGLRLYASIVYYGIQLSNNQTFFQNWNFSKKVPELLFTESVFNLCCSKLFSGKVAADLCREEPWFLNHPFQRQSLLIRKDHFILIFRCQIDFRRRSTCTKLLHVFTYDANLCRLFISVFFIWKVSRRQMRQINFNIFETELIQKRKKFYFSYKACAWKSW